MHTVIELRCNNRRGWTLREFFLLLKPVIYHIRHVHRYSTRVIVRGWIIIQQYMRIDHRLRLTQNPINGMIFQFVPSATAQ